MSNTPSWDAGLMQLGSVEQIHAIGAFALYYNDLERTLYALFSHFVPLSNAPLQFLFVTLNNRGRVDLIKKIAGETGDGVEIGAVLHAFQCFEVCSENRNLLLHGIPLKFSADTITIGKAVDNRKGEVRFYTFTLDQIRNAAKSAARALRHYTEPYPALAR